MLARAGFVQWRIESSGDLGLLAVAYKVRDDEDTIDAIIPYAVIATLNGLDHTKELERSLSESSLKLRAVFVDNGSTDGTRDWLKGLHALDQICIVNERNLGVAASWNLGIKLAILNGADAVFLCGNDTQPFPGTIERLAAHVARGCAFVTGTARPYTAEMKSVKLFNGDQRLLSSLDFAFCILSLRAVKALTAFEVTHGLKTLPEDVGLFDSRFYPAYFEDSDYAVRLALAGIPAVRDPGALFRHDVALTTRSNPGIMMDVKDGFRANENLFRNKWGFSPLETEGRKPPVALKSAWAMIVGDATAECSADDVVRQSVAAIGGPVCASSECVLQEVSASTDVASSTALEPAVVTDEPAQAVVRHGAGRILWTSNGPWVPSGYGVQTRLFVPRIRDLGYDVAVHCFFGHQGGMGEWQGVRVYPASGHPASQDVLGIHAADFDADFVLFFCDAWALDFDMIGPSVRIVPWFPVDGRLTAALHE